MKKRDAKRIKNQTNNQERIVAKKIERKKEEGKGKGKENKKISFFSGPSAKKESPGKSERDTK